MARPTPNVVAPLAGTRLPPRGPLWSIPLPSTITLAFQRVRQTWGLLLVTGIGIVAAVMLVCTIPLYSEVAMTAGLRSDLSSFAQNGDIVVRSTPRLISSSIINSTTQSLNKEFQKTLGAYLEPTQFSIQTQLFPILAKGRSGSLQPTGVNIGLIGAPTDQATSHIRLLQGRLPAANERAGDLSVAPIGNDIEIAIIPDTASRLQAKVGSVLNVNISLIDGSQRKSSRLLALHIVGIFTLASANDSFWHGENFAPSVGLITSYSGLASNATILSMFNRISNEAQNTLHHQQQVFYFPANLIWYYHLDTSRIKIDDLNTLIYGINTVQLDNANNSDLEQSPFLEQTQTYLPSTDVLVNFSNRISIAQLPVYSLLILLLVLVLFFIAMMTNLLVDRQADTIAVLRSRGASRRQIFGSLVTQSIGLGLIAFVAGPVLAIMLARFLAQNTLSAADQGALNTITADPLQVAVGLSLFALGAAAVTIIAMIVAVFAATNRDVLAMRREAARSTRRPLWQRLNVDMVAALIALVGFGSAFYLTNSGVLDAELRLLLLSPLALLQACFVALAGLLLLLRYFPALLQAGAWLATRRRGAPPLLALAQMSRSPRQSARMTLLLALASAFAIFTLVFTATQSQRILDVAAYQAGADFSGAIPVAIAPPQQLVTTTAAYKHIPGVTSATAGFTKQATAGGAVLNIPIDFKAVDADTFANTAAWTEQDSSQSLGSLMGQLSAQRTSAMARDVVPAIVDANTWNSLHLSQGANFTLNFAIEDFRHLVNFTAIAEVQHIPSPGDTSIAGVLVDYLTFADVYTKHFTTVSGTDVPMNYVWLRTRDDAATLSNVRKVLSQGEIRLVPLYDRRAMIDTLYHDPLYLTLVGVLALGATITLLLALLGNLIASWLSARSRLTNFAALRALGATPRQIGSVLTWEQAIIYITAILLGIIFGALLSALALPSLVFTSVLPSQVTGAISNQVFYAAQSTPPLQIIIPTSLSIALGVLIATLIVALGMMIFVVSRPSISQALRLNED